MNTANFRFKCLEILKTIFREKQGGASRKALLYLCAVDGICEKIKPDGPLDEFCAELLYTLDQCSVACHPAGREKALIVFFREYLTNFSEFGTAYEHEAAFIREFLEARNKQSAKPNGARQKKTEGVRLRSDISDYDLRGMVGAFVETFKDPEGIFGFSIGGNAKYIIEGFFLDRLLRAYKNEIRPQGEESDTQGYQKYAVTVSSFDESESGVDLATRVEETILSSLEQWFKNDENNDLIVVVSNNNIDEADFTPMVERAWHDLRAKASFLNGTGRIFLTFWVNNNQPATRIGHERFKALPAPEIMTNALWNELKDALRKKGLDDLEIQYRKNQLDKCKNNQTAFYSHLYDIFYNSTRSA